MLCPFPRSYLVPGWRDAIFQSMHWMSTSTISLLGSATWGNLYRREPAFALSMALLIFTLSVHAHTVYIGLYNLKPHWLCIYIACTLETHVHTLYVHGMYMVYDLHTVCKHHIYNASCRRSSFLYIDCLDLSRPYSYLSEVAICNYLESGQSMSGSVQVVRILWLFSFSGKYIYIRVNTLYIHVFTRKTEKS